MAFYNPNNQMMQNINTDYHRPQMQQVPQMQQLYNQAYGTYNQYQPPITIPQAPMLSGRVINDISEVTAQEVPMDGRVSVFPKSDYSCMYAKVWTSEGTIRTFKFVPEQPNVVEEPKVDIDKLINDRFDELKALITQNNKHYYKKKEGVNDVQSS